MNEWHNAEYHAEKAHQFYEAGQWARALDELKLALAVNPEQSDWHFGMGLTLEALHRYDEAIESFEQVLKLRGQDVETMFRLGMALLRSGRGRRAIGALERVSDLDPEHEPSYCFRIAAYTELGEHDLAEQMFYLAQQITDQCPQCYDHIALSLALRGDLDRAIWCWQRALKIDPRYPDAYANLARAHWQKGQLDRASQLYVLHLREDPGDISSLLQLGNLMIEMGRRADARERFNRALELDPTATDAYLHLGELSLVAGQLDAATAQLEMASRLSSDRPGVQLCLARVAQQRGDNVAVRRHVLAELERTGQTASQTLMLAQLLIDVGLTARAVTLLDSLINGRDEQPPLGQDQLAAALLCRGVALVFENRVHAGLVQFRRSLRLSPQNAPAMMRMAQAYLRLHQPRRAGRWLSRAWKLGPRDGDLRRLRRRVLAAYLLSPFRHVWCGIRDTWRNVRQGGNAGPKRPPA